MSRLERIGREEIEENKRPDNGPSLIIPIIAFSALVLVGFFVLSGSAFAVAVYESATTTTTTSTTSTSTSTTTTTSSTASTTVTSTTTTSTTATTTTTTSTTLCGGYFEQPCVVERPCNIGYVENSRGVCVPYECAQTSESGNPGCGSQNLNLPDNWCQPGGHNPFSTRRTSLL
ncbi:MAG: hypothetical protein GF416_07620 [Candidatus Altiarchaeales archaeon]|nr:hypothetical protein [Candidatus Altiarchaeales archaeon]MBD3416980.1 hypothetical protein [Candidatus Altiarchaeales archaeon]